MKNDREYYGKAYRIIRLVRYLVLVILVLFTVFSMAIYKNDITFDNFRYLMRYVEFTSPGSSTGDGNISFSAGSDDNFVMVDGALAKTTKKDIITYDMNGKKLLSENFSLQNPVTVENGNYVLLYDFGGTSLSLYNSFSCVFEKKFPNGIDYAYLSDDGSFALITSEKNYSGGVVAYDNNFKHVFTFMHPASRVTDVCFNGKSGLLACATTDVQNGKFLSEILVFDTKSLAEEVKSTTHITGELPLNMFCAGENFAVMTDKGIHIFDDDCNNVSFCDFGYDTPCAVYRFDNSFAVCLKSAVASTDTKLVLYSYSGNVIMEQAFSSEISHVAKKGDRLFILDPSRLSIYDMSDDQVPLVLEHSHDGRYKKVFPNGSERYILVSSSGSEGFPINRQTSENT